MTKARNLHKKGKPRRILVVVVNDVIMQMAHSIFIRHVFEFQQYFKTSPEHDRARVRYLQGRELSECAICYKFARVKKTKKM